nr:hypothetical protein [Methylobacterium currus]
MRWQASARLLDPCFVADFCRNIGNRFCDICLADHDTERDGFVHIAAIVTGMRAMRASAVGASALMSPTSLLCTYQTFASGSWAIRMAGGGMARPWNGETIVAEGDAIFSGANRHPTLIASWQRVC